MEFYDVYLSNTGNKVECTVTVNTIDIESILHTENHSVHTTVRHVTLPCAGKHRSFAALPTKEDNNKMTKTNMSKQKDKFRYENYIVDIMNGERKLKTELCRP